MKLKLRDVRRISITGEFIRLDALIKYASIASTGGEAKFLIREGKIFVGGEPCTQRGKKIKNGDVVRYGREILIVYSDVSVCQKTRDGHPCGGDEY